MTAEMPGASESVRAEAQDLLVKAGLNKDIAIVYDDMADEVIFVPLSQRGELIMELADFGDIVGRDIVLAS